MTEQLPILSAKNLSHIFSDGTAGIRNINIDINSGDFLVISGPNGSGKSVLMKHLNGLLKPSEGEVFLKGVPIGKDIVSARSKIGLVFQDADSQIIGQTVERDTAFGPENLRLTRNEIKDRVDKALRDVNLQDRKNTRPHILSGGEKRRLAVAGVLAMDPKVLIFDEPFSNLDYPGVRQVLKQITTLHKQGHTIIVITHDLGKVLAHATELIIMSRGEIVEQGQPDELLDSLEKWGIRRPSEISVSGMTWLK